MAQARVVWIEENAFVGVDGSARSVVVSSKQGSAAYGLRPTELFLISLASCTAVTFVQVMQKKRQPLQGLEIAIEGDQQPDPPWRFTNIRMTYRIRGQGLDQEAIRRSIELSERKYCAVSATLSDDVDLKSEFEVLPPKSDSG